MARGRLTVENAGRQNHSVKVIPNNCLPEIRARSARRPLNSRGPGLASGSRARPLAGPPPPSAPRLGRESSLASLGRQGPIPHSHPFILPCWPVRWTLPGLEPFLASPPSSWVASSSLGATALPSRGGAAGPLSSDFPGPALPLESKQEAAWGLVSPAPYEDRLARLGLRGTLPASPLSPARCTEGPRCAAWPLASRSYRCLWPQTASRPAWVRRLRRGGAVLAKAGE